MWPKFSSRQIERRLPCHSETVKYNRMGRIQQHKRKFRKSSKNLPCMFYPRHEIAEKYVFERACDIRLTTLFHAAHRYIFVCLPFREQHRVKTAILCFRYCQTNVFGVTTKELQCLKRACLTQKVCCVMSLLDYLNANGYRDLHSSMLVAAVDIKLISLLALLPNCWRTTGLHIVHEHVFWVHTFTIATDRPINKAWKITKKLN